MDTVKYWRYDFEGDIDNLVGRSRLIQDYRMGDFKKLEGGGWNEIEHTAMCKKYITYTKNDDGTLTIDNHCIDFASIYMSLRGQYTSEATIHADKQYGQKNYIDPDKHEAGKTTDRRWFLNCIEKYYDYLHELRRRSFRDRFSNSTIAKIDLKIGYEEIISLAVAKAIIKNVPANVRYICFSDTHGDIAAYLVGVLLSNTFHNAYVFSLGDAINQKWDFWDSSRRADQWSQDAEYRIRDWYIEKIERELLELDENFICVHGNHDAEFQGYRPSRAVIINTKYQLLFQHAIISPPFEDLMVTNPWKTINHNDDVIYLYKSKDYTNDDEQKYNDLTSDGFLRATHNDDDLERALKVDLKTIDNSIYEIITKAAGDKPITYNPYCAFGHDYTYFYIAALVKTMKINTIPGDGNKIDELESKLRVEASNIADLKFKMNRSSNIGIFARIFDCDGCIYCLFRQKMEGGSDSGSKTISIFIIAIAAIIVIAIICYVIMYVITLKTVKDFGENHFPL